MNYTEKILFFKSEIQSNDGWEILQTDIPENVFNVLLKQFANRRNYKFFEKDFKCYTKGDVHCENYNNKDIRLIQKKLLDATIDHEEKVINCNYEHTKLPYHIFPSTMQIQDISYVKRATAKVHSRVSLHFDYVINPHINEGKVVRRDWVSCHKGGNVDTDNLEIVLKTVMTDLILAMRQARMESIY